MQTLIPCPFPLGDANKRSPSTRHSRTEACAFHSRDTSSTSQVGRSDAAAGSGMAGTVQLNV